MSAKVTKTLHGISSKHLPSGRAPIFPFVGTTLKMVLSADIILSSHLFIQTPYCTINIACYFPFIGATLNVNKLVKMMQIGKGNHVHKSCDCARRVISLTALQLHLQNILLYQHNQKGQEQVMQKNLRIKKGGVGLMLQSLMCTELWYTSSIMQGLVTSNLNDYFVSYALQQELMFRALAVYFLFATRALRAHPRALTMHMFIGIYRACMRWPASGQCHLYDGRVSE